MPPLAPPLATPEPDAGRQAAEGGVLTGLMSVSVLYEDDDLLAVDKPAGVVIHPAYRHPDGTLFDAVAARQAARGQGLPWLLHRLDRDTSGVVLLAKSERARRGLVRQFEHRQVRKWYLAVVRRAPEPSAGEVNKPLRRDPEDRRRVIVDPAGQEAVTHFRVVAADGHGALVLAAPLTGRTHQIRAHLAWLGAPIAGDGTYGGTGAGAGAREDRALPATRQMLHAWTLLARHPLHDTPLWIQSPVPPDMAALLPEDWLARRLPTQHELVGLSS